MSWETVIDETWQRIDPGLYVNDRGYEITRTGPRTWTLSGLTIDETRHRTLKAAQAHADRA